MKRTPTQYEKTSAKRIRQLIDDYCDGKQIVFAEKIGIGKASVSQYVNETNYPNNKTCGLIAKVFNINPMWVMGFDAPMETPPEQKEFADAIDVYTSLRQKMIESVTEKELQVLSSYRHANTAIKSAVDKLLDIESNDKIVTFAARPNANPNAGDSDSIEDDLNRLEDNK